MGATELGQVDVLHGLPQIPSYAVLDEKATDIDLEALEAAQESREDGG